MKLNIKHIQKFFKTDIVDINPNGEKYIRFDSFTLMYELIIFNSNNMVSVTITPEAFKQDYYALASTVKCDEITYHGPDQYGTDSLYFTNTEEDITHMTVSKTNDNKFQVSIGCNK